jgi:hypothetical protein
VKEFFHFGETMAGYEVPVLNEREVRASAGILFFFALIAFMNAWLVGDFYLTRVFVVAFMIDFSIRLFVNPMYSPTMIAGRLFVRKQREEYVGAPQKRFAWGIGLLLAVTMFFLIVVNNVIGPINLIICSTCLLLLFFESAFGICLGCKVYNIVFKERAQLCPGDSCEVSGAMRAPPFTLGQVGVTLLFLLAIAAAGKLITSELQTAPSVTHGDGDLERQQRARVTDSCEVPDWAVALGHTEKWKLHNNCKSPVMLPAGAVVAAAVEQPRIEIIALAHPPVQSALKPLRDWLATQSGRLRVVEIDAKSAEGEQQLATAGLKGHVPILILIDGKYRFDRKDGTRTEFLNFPAAAGNPMGLNGTWTTADVQTLLSGKVM